MDQEKSYLVADIIGCTVMTMENENLGVLNDVIRTGSNDVYVVGEGKNELLIPALKSVVHEIDIGKKIIRVTLPKGLKEALTAS
jgi:16S rRNA processing protein RimM